MQSSITLVQMCTPSHLCTNRLRLRDTLKSHPYPPEQRIPRSLDPESSEKRIGTSPAANRCCERGGGQGVEGEARYGPFLPRGQFSSNHQWSFTVKENHHCLIIYRRGSHHPQFCFFDLFTTPSLLPAFPASPPALPGCRAPIINWSIGCGSCSGQ